MKKILLAVILSLWSFTFYGCEVIGDIFKAGFWVGIIAVILLIAIIGFIVRLFKR